MTSLTQGGTITLSVTSSVVHVYTKYGGVTIFLNFQGKQKLFREIREFEITRVKM